MNGEIPKAVGQQRVLEIRLPQPLALPICTGISVCRNMTEQPSLKAQIPTIQEIIVPGYFLSFPGPFL